MSPLPYSSTSDPRFRDRFLDGARFHLLPDPATPEIVTVNGACPRCGHPLSHTFELYEPDDYGPEGGEEPIEIVLQCMCPDEHPGRPANRSTGCGAGWRVTLPTGQQ
ncbi:hypothetical protein GCM10012275_45950 [Longimycelium tulufanense]|uniref:Uncharacterized protein n=1 Tax=Longimycelium tulufanense TaxID=907463 RepID=A0A8J3CBK5_9PSEU|nr:hypothetical protein [Longimycelium tulufanense]GGM70364.1 hypothetical protein GCM10012275_45950 [Longimycelium tulufanense]